MWFPVPACRFGHPGQACFWTSLGSIVVQDQLSRVSTAVVALNNARSLYSDVLECTDESQIPKLMIYRAL